MSVADINQRVDAAVAAIDAGDYATAHRKLLAAKALLSGMPDTQKGQSMLRWDRAAIDSLIATVERQIQVSTAAATNSRGVVRTKIRYRRAGSCDEPC